MSQASEPTEQQSSKNNEQLSSNEVVQNEGEQGEDVQEELLNEKEEEEERDEQSESQEEEEEEEEEELSPEELKIKEQEALELIRERHEARLARQERTRAKIAELTQRMAEKNMLRKRWLPPVVVEPLRTFYTGYGFFNNLTEAALFTLGEGGTTHTLMRIISKLETNRGIDNPETKKQLCGFVLSASYQGYTNRN
ncbi:hypothetical protein ACTXT7_002627 [Hymenolepis weldensis]